jgi:NADH-quinone oxidoreductase subunit E
MFGGVVFVAVFAVMWILMRGTMEPPRGPGNIRKSDTPLTRGETGTAASAVPVGNTAPASPASGAAKSGSQARGSASAAAAPNADGPDTDAMSKPELLSGPRGGGADDLKMIKGVGPKLEGVLHDIGVYHFDQIASWTAEEVAWADENLVGFKGRVSRDDWVAQAKALAAGQDTEFSQRVDKGDVY